MDRKDILEYLGDDWIRTGELIRSSLDSDIDLLNWTNSYILEHGGKQLRPMLSLLMARACGDGPLPMDSIRFAAACELLHNATLLHDDVADGSMVRRGAPTVASILDPSHSVLVGDYLAVAVGWDLSLDELGGLFRNSIAYSFLAPDDKARLLAWWEDAWKEAIR